MKINDYKASITEKMSEFDMWVTPSLGEIRDTLQFKHNLEELTRGFDYVSQITEDFCDISKCSSSVLSENTLKYINTLDNDEESKEVINSVCNVLLLATGKTDNNLKCQFPLMLKNQIGISTYPQKVSNRWKDKEIPRTFLMTDVAKVIVQLKERSEYQKIITESYFHLIISDETYAKQLWSLGNAYVSQKKLGNADSLISSIVVFQSRGSITATQGHIPETILRNYMTEWGMEAGTDFNTQDVEVGEIIGDLIIDKQLKKRKYDFIIPFQTKKSGAKIFIQSQFYAGDSGSVSHKVVDQTDSTREVTLKKYPNAVFWSILMEQVIFLL